jgi:hypothetical protein
LRLDVRPLAARARRIHPRSATSVSLVATDGGNNSLRFDPFMLQIIRVVESNDNELCLEVITPTTPIVELDARQFDRGGQPVTSLGRLMMALNVSLSKSSAISYALMTKGYREALQSFRSIGNWLSGPFSTTY